MLRLSRRESLRFHVKRHPMWLDYTAGCDDAGTLVAVRARIVGDNGAYASVGGKVLERAAGHACGPYRVPNVDVEARAVYTNNPPSGAMRGFGANQAAFALEGVLDMLAEQVGIDGWEFRWRNALDVGDRSTTGQRLGEGVGVRATLLAVRDAYKGARHAGIACAIKNVGVGNGLAERGRAVLRPEADGTLTLFHSWTEMGQGAHTVFRQLAAEELGHRAGADPGRGGHRPRARHRGDHGLAGDAARRPCGPRRLRRPGRRPRRGAAGGPGRARVRGRVPRRLDDAAGRRHGGAGHPCRLRLGDPGGHPRRRWADRAGRRGPRRGTGAQSRPAEGPGGGRRPHGPGHGADRGVPGGGRRSRHGHAQVAGHHPGCHDAAGRDDPGGGAAARGPARREGDGGGRAGPDGGRGGRRAPRVRRDPPDTAADARFGGSPGAPAPAGNALRSGRGSTTGGRP